MNQQRIREFEFTDTNFEKIREFVNHHTGIVLTKAKKDMVYGRLAKRIRNSSLNSFDEFCDAIEDGDKNEQECLINAITTNLTAFFRENHHFEFLVRVVIPKIIKENMRSKRVRIWSAGCSTGEEPYSIAMTLRESVPNIDDWDIKILATDLDANVLKHGVQGVYREERINGISEKRLKRWFKPGKGDNVGMLKVCSDLQRMITFKRLNLLHSWPMKGPFDLIFCRNVVIYFDKLTRKILFERYAKMLMPKAYLFIGHSESLYNINTDFESLGRTMYQRK